MSTSGSKPAASPAPPPHWHALTTEEVARALRTDPTRGLSSTEHAARLAAVGENALPQGQRRALLGIFLGQFKSPLIYLLLLAGGVAFLLGHTSDAGVIFTVVLLNAGVGTLQEGRAERSLHALRQLVVPLTRVLRNGAHCTVDSRQLVPGDILVLDAGDAIVADARLVSSSGLQVAEAALTGESASIAKAIAALPSGTQLADRSNMAYAGTYVTAGHAAAVVVETGAGTELGRIATLAQAATPPPTPLEQRIARFGRGIIVAACVLFGVVNLIGWLHGLPFGEVVMVALSQVVGMIPEGLPVAMTIALAVGVQRMAARHAIVRQLPAVETLGSTTVICTDKTGTLTRNEMTVTALTLPDGRDYEVTGVGYDPVGTLRQRGEPAEVEAPVRELLEAAVLCNDAHLRPRDDVEGAWITLGDPTEIALLVVAQKAGIEIEDLRRRRPRTAELPFDSGTKLMATQHITPEGPVVLLKGAPEVLIAMSLPAESAAPEEGEEDAVARRRQAQETIAARLAQRGLRVLAVGACQGGDLTSAGALSRLSGRVKLLGFVGEHDPPRREAKEAVLRCHDAGIRVAMVTGDHKDTAQAVALAVGIGSTSSLAVDGPELEGMTDAQLAEKLDRIAVFARVHPAQKLRIVEAYQERGQVVAMTGDGVNDAPALVQANVGVAMGLTGTEVAKEAAKIVVADDNFTSIVSAVEEGRIVYRNIKKVILYLFSTSLAEVLVLLLALLLGYPPPLAAVQILWINLVTEGTVTVNLIMEPAEGDEMNQRPISSDEPLLTRGMLTRIAFMTPAMTLSTVGWFIYRLSEGAPFPQAQTETFTVLAVCQWFNAVSCRSETQSSLSRSILRNPWLLGGLAVSNALQLAVVFFPPLARVFHTVPLDWGQALLLGAVASLVFWVEELRKLVVRRRSPQP